MNEGLWETLGAARMPLHTVHVTNRLGAGAAE